MGPITKFALSFIWAVRRRVSIVFQELAGDKLDIARTKNTSDYFLDYIDIDMDKLDCSNIDFEKAENLLDMYLQHRFDLLGSGWVTCDFSDSSNGIEGYRYSCVALETDSKGDFLSHIMRKKHFNEAKRIYSMIDDDYIPIDWQKDYKSGYRWGSEHRYYPRVLASKTGGDIKVPWELSRLQHLPRLAILAKVFPEKRDLLFREFRNELLDFIAQNPVRMGVNHMCTMDVGIRVANIALCCSLWNGMELEFDENFEKEVVRYLINECNFIRKNLEWSYYLTSNHYFANIAGLLWGSTVLPKGKKRNKWIHFASSELNKEIVKQFYEEGSNAEGSTAYHRLTSEMATYSLALLYYLNRHGENINIDDRAKEIIYGSAHFLDAIIRPDNSFTQIGDNDSGLFFRLSITGELISNKDAIALYKNLNNYRSKNENEKYLDENMNDARPYLSAWTGLFDDNDLLYAKEMYPLESSLINQLVYKKIRIENKKKYYEEKTDFVELENVSSMSFYSEKYDLIENIHRIDFPQFGIYIFKGDNIYVCMNASRNGQNGNGGHAHNDKLSFELFIGKECIIEDPGVYVYTALPDLRNEYRSTCAHNTIYIGEEQNEFLNLFSMKERTVCKLVSISDTSICLQCCYGDVIHERRINIFSNRVEVTDWCNKKFTMSNMKHQVCRGYGKMLNRN